MLAASVYRGLGSLEGALAMVERAMKRVDLDDEARLARVHHQWAKLLLQSREPEKARAHLERAIVLYERANDPYNEVRAKTLLPEVLEALGRPEAALACAMDALESASRHEFGRLKVFAHLELGRVLLGRGRHDEALEELRRGLGAAIVLSDPNAQLHAHVRLWKAYALLGEAQAAAAELRHTAALAGGVDEVSDEIDELLRQAASDGGKPRPRVTRQVG